MNTNIKNKNNSVMGIDVELTNWITLSDSQVVHRPKFLAKSLKKIKTLQRKLLSKKKKGSHNKLKAKRIQLAKLCRKVGLKREDYRHNVTTDLTKLYGTLIFEKLSITNMVKNHNLATSILDATWYKIKQLAAAYNAEVYQVIAKDTPDLF